MGEGPISTQDHTQDESRQLTPREVRLNLHAILKHSSHQRLGVALKVLHAVLIRKRVHERHRVLVLDRKSVLRHEYRELVLFPDIVEERAEALGVRLEPRAVRLSTELSAVCARESVVGETLELV